MRVDFGDDTYSIITRDASGAVIEVQHDSTDTYTYESANGLLETGYIEDGTRDSFSYSFDTSSILPLKPWDTQEGEQIVRYGNSDEIERVGFSYRALGRAPYRIGACTYDAIKVLTFYQFEDVQTMVELTFLTDLGIPINTAYGADGSVDLFRPISITAE